MESYIGMFSVSIVFVASGIYFAGKKYYLSAVAFLVGFALIVLHDINRGPNSFSFVSESADWMKKAELLEVLGKVEVSSSNVVIIFRQENNGDLRDTLMGGKGTAQIHKGMLVRWDDKRKVLIPYAQIIKPSCTNSPSGEK